MNGRGSNYSYNADTRDGKRAIPPATRSLLRGMQPTVFEHRGTLAVVRFLITTAVGNPFYDMAALVNLGPIWCFFGIVTWNN